MSEQRDPNQIDLCFHGENIPLEAMAKGMAALDGLWRAVTEEVCGDPDAVRLVVTGLRFVCDGCGRDRPEQHDDWVYRDGDDLCPAWQAAPPSDRGQG